MLYAVEPQSKEQIRPSQTGQIAICPGCGGKVHAVMPATKISHWRHNDRDCDPWYEPMSAWHIAWQDCYPKEWKEVWMGKEGTSHRADICRPDGKVIEFQNSGITVAEALEREAFYGDMSWVFNFGGPKSFAIMKKVRIPQSLDIAPIPSEEQLLSIDALLAVMNSPEYTEVKGHLWANVMKDSARLYLSHSCPDGDLSIWLSGLGYMITNIWDPYITYSLKLQGLNSRLIKHLQKPVFLDPGDDITDLYYRKDPETEWTTVDKATFISRFNQYPPCPTP